eukprot:3527736-Amphidinium_carterae.1
MASRPSRVRNQRKIRFDNQNPQARRFKVDNRISLDLFASHHPTAPVMYTFVIFDLRRHLRQTFVDHEPDQIHPHSKTEITNKENG